MGARTGSSVAPRVLIAASDLSQIPLNWPRQTRYSPENSRISEIECPSPPPPTQLPTVKIRRVDSAEEARLLSPFRSSTWDCHVALLCFSPAPRSCFLPSMFPVINISFSVNFEFSLFSSRTVLRIGNPFSFSSLFVTFRRGEARVCCGTAVFQARVHCSARSFQGLASRALQFFAFL